MDSARMQPRAAIPAPATGTPPVPRQSPEQPAFGLDDDALAAVVTDVWQQQIGRTLRRQPSADRPPGAEFAVSAAASIGDGADLFVTLRAPAGVAAAVATARLDLHEDELATGDIDDAFTELLSDVAGRLAHLVPDTGAVGPSLVVQGSGLSVSVAGAELACDVTLLAGSAPVRVSVWRPRGR